MSPVLVTGANGYLGTWLVTRLLQAGASVRGMVRSPDREAGLREAVRRGGADDAELAIVVAGLTADDGWAGAVAGCEGVYHVASPMIQSENADDLIVPAREGALRALRAARDGGARRVVLTSSFAAVGYSAKPERDYTEDDWTDPDTPGLPPYPRSKAVAERAAWDFVAEQGDGLELVAINPTWIAGPTLTAQARSSLQMFTAMLGGHVSLAPRQRFGVADVRDVADLHIAAMTTPTAAGRRYLALADGPTTTWLDLALLLRERFGDLAALAPTEQAPGDGLPPLVIHNDRAKTELGFQPRPWRATVVETVESMNDLGLL